MFGELMNDRVTIRTQDGRTFPDVQASVQKGKVFMERTDIPIKVGDQVIRETPAGVKEVFIVDDPGFSTGMGSLPDTYQMKVHRADSPAPADRPVVYNVIGANARINIGSADASTNVVNQAPEELFETLREVIRTQIVDAEFREQLIAKSKELEQEAGKPSFGVKYAEFIGLAANHMSLLAPFIPALSQFIPVS